MKISELLTRARLAVKVKDFRQAEGLLEKVLSENPDHIMANLLLGNVYNWSGRPAKAEMCFLIILHRQPENLDALNNLGLALKDLGRYKEAVAALIKASAIDRDRADIRFNLGNAHKEAGELEMAIEEYTQAIMIKPEYSAPYNNLGTVLEKLGRTDEARQTYRKGLMHDKNNPRLLFNLGRIYETEGNAKAAAEQYTLALKAKPGWFDALSRLGGLFGKAGDHRKAINAYDQILKMDPGHANALYNTGLEYGRLNDLESAVEYYRKALDSNPEYRKIILSFGSFLENEGYFVESLKELENLIQIDPADPEARFAYITVLVSMGQYEKALKTAATLLVDEHRSEKALKTIAGIYLVMRDCRKADKYVSKLRKLDREKYGFDFEFDKLAGNPETLKSRFADVKRFIDAFDRDVNLIAFLGDLYFESKLMDEAMELYLLAIEVKPKFLRPYQSLARILIAQGKTEDAVRIISRIVTIQGNRITPQDMSDLMGTLNQYESVLARFDREMMGDKNKFSVKTYFDEHGKKKSVVIPGVFDEDEAMAPIIDIGEREPLLQVKEEEEILKIDEITGAIDEDFVEIGDAEPESLTKLLENQELYDESAMLKILQAQQELLNDLSKKLKDTEKAKPEEITEVDLNDPTLGLSGASLKSTYRGPSAAGSQGGNAADQAGDATGPQNVSGMTGMTGAAGTTGMNQMTGNAGMTGMTGSGMPANLGPGAAGASDKDSLMSRILMTQQEILMSISNKLNTLSDNSVSGPANKAQQNPPLTANGIVEPLKNEILDGLQAGINKLADTLKSQYKVLPIPIGTDVSFTPDGRAVVKQPMESARAVEEKLEKAHESLESLEAKVMRQEMRDYIRKIRDKLDTTATRDEKTGKTIFKPAKEEPGQEKPGIGDDDLKKKLDMGQAKLKGIHDKIINEINKNRVKDGIEPLVSELPGKKTGKKKEERRVYSGADRRGTGKPGESAAQGEQRKKPSVFRKILTRIVDFILNRKPGDK